jgi:hypothetical protein
MCMFLNQFDYSNSEHHGPGTETHKWFVQVFWPQLLLFNFNQLLVLYLIPAYCANVVMTDEEN